MGNKQPVSAASDDRETGWLVVDIFPEDSISFNPVSSYGVCAGIGEQAGLEKSTNLGPAADRDAVGVAKLFNKKFKVPDDQIIILTSQTKPATDKALISALKHQAGKVKEDGILIFQFSGHVHRIEKRDMVVFIPANFDGSGRSVITIKRLLKAIQGTKAKYIVMVMDCCYAGGVAEELVLNIPDDIPTYILASCTSTQKSLSFNELGNGFFTYFFLKYFDFYRESTFPLKKVVTYCKPLCDAINKLLKPGFDNDPSMSPQILWNTYKIKIMDIKKKGYDETDSATKSVKEDPLAFVHKYHRYFASTAANDGSSPWEKSEVPELVTAWLHVTACDSLKYLHDVKILKKSEAGLFSTVVAFVAQSVASLTYREVKNTNSLSPMFKASAILESFITFSEILHKTINYNLAPTRSDLCRYLEYFSYKTKLLTNKDYGDPEFTEIVLLLTQVFDDAEIKKQSKGGRMRRGYDEADGGGDENDGVADDEGDEEFDNVDYHDLQKLGAYLDNLPLAASFVELPKIEDVSSEDEEDDDGSSVVHKDIP